MQITIDGKTYNLIPCEEDTGDTKDIATKPKKTGYERAERDGKYFLERVCCKEADSDEDEYGAYDDTVFETANYYADEKLAKDNIRADRLLRRLRRFSAVNRKNKIDWENSDQTKFHIIFDYDEEGLYVTEKYIIRCFGEINFDTKELAEKAIEEFRDDLMWYFTEYKDITEESAEDDD